MRKTLALPLAAALALPSVPASADDSLWQVEARAGYGLALSGSADSMSRRLTPLTLEALVDVAIEEDPPLRAYGGLLVETIDRNSAGAAFGVKHLPTGTPLRLALGGAVLIAPYTLVGATASGGACRHASALFDVCGDIQLTSYFAGSDLADGHAVTQLQLVIGMVFDAH